jgi:hypothetical protein
MISPANEATRVSSVDARLLFNATERSPVIAVMANVMTPRAMTTSMRENAGAFLVQLGHLMGG